MKNSTLITIILAFLLSSVPLFAQKEPPFNAQEKIYLKGNSVLIGNTILGKHPKYAFDEVKILNDQVPLNFVDVDEDDTTFSSSAASFTLPETARQIKYAGLYWGGLYPAHSSSKRKGRRKMKYDYLGERNPNVQEIKLKINETEYQDIIGQVIFDSEAKGPFAKESPYACFMDITPQMQNQQGEINITVANIRATKGFIEGGAAAGWLVYLVYEDDTASPKYFTSYSGFKEVSKDVVEVIFEDLQPAPEDTSSSKIMMATLEGDTRIKGDACAIYSDLKEQFLPLSAEGRPSNNFFNSTISVGYKTPMTRIPASKNTLGFDLLKMNVPDSTITSNTTNATIRLSTKQDRFYTFFLAFETEIEEALLETQPQEISNIDSEKAVTIETEPINTSISGPPPVFTNPTPVTENTSTAIPANTNTRVVKNDISTNETIYESSVIENKDLTEEEKTILALETIERRPPVSAKGMIAGYYLVTNVFEVKSNATAWKQRLNEEGYNARTFINKDTQAIYVYIESSKTPEEMQLRKEILRQIPHLSKTWVCRVNL